MRDKAIIQQGKHAFMMGRGLQRTDRGWQVLNAENPYDLGTFQHHLWGVGYKQREDEFYRGRKGGNQ